MRCSLKNIKTNIRLGKIWVQPKEYDVWTGLARHLALFGVWIPVLSVVCGFLLLPLAAISTTLVVVIVAAFVPSLRGIVALNSTMFRVKKSTP